MDISSNASNVLSVTKEKDTVHFETHAWPSEWNLRDVLPKDGKPWYTQRHLLLLNLGMIIPYLSSTTNGYDGFIFTPRETKHDLMRHILQFL